MAEDVSVVILAAGQGTRMKSRTAKVLHRICGREMVLYPISQAQALGARRIVLVLGHQHEEVAAAALRAMGAGTVEIALQLEQKGTAHAVEQAMGKLGDAAGPVMILYGDVPLLQRETLAGLRVAWRPGGLALVTARFANPFGYGRIVRDAAGALVRIVEEKDATPAERRIDEINAGLYCVDGALLRQAIGRVGQKNVQREFYLTDLAELAAAQGPVATLEVEAEEVAGVNDRAQLVACEAVMRRRLVHALSVNGVTVRDPEGLQIDAGVEVGADTELGAAVELRGKTRIGTGCRVEAGSIVVDSTLADGVHVKPYCVIEESVVGAAAVVGPFAHLRPGTELAESVHVGNFVETKKARLGRGAKANHLSYLGDADIGAKVNVGAGTITCNYDGVTKHKTIIEEGAFIGSDSQLVAPVKVGAGAYVGAGTTVTEDVPAGALALTRPPQKNIEGYVERKRARKGET